MVDAKQYAPNFRVVVAGQTLQLGRTIDVLSLTVTDADSGPSQFNFTVQDRRPELSRLFASGERLKWMDSNTFDLGQEVEIHMGYAEDLQSMILGRIDGVSVSFSEGSPPTLEIEGSSLYKDLQKRRRRKPYQSTTDSGIVEQIADAMGFQVQAERTQIEHPIYSPNGRTYAEILEDLARRNDYEVLTKGRTLLFRQPRYKKSLTADCTYEWGRNLLSFSTRISTHGVESQVSSRASQTAQGGGKSAIVGKASAGQERGKMGRESASEMVRRIYQQYPEEEDSAPLLPSHDIENQQEANERARAAFERRSLGLIEGRAAVIGDPNLRAGLVVELIGLGNRWTGLYYITSTTHTIGGSGYRTDFNVKRNAL